MIACRYRSGAACGWRILPSLSMLAVAARVYAATFYVSLDGSNGAGTNWVTAKQTIQGGVNLAVTAGDEVVVSNGTYVLATAITVPRAITIRSHQEDPSTVRISGNGTTHCIEMTAAATLSGLTITNGNHGATPGGGIVIAAGTVSNCYVVNSVSRRGGGIYMTGAGQVVGCTFFTNRASMYNGGAIWMATGTVRDCLFMFNYAANEGGAIYASGGIISNCTFTANSSTVAGGACEIVNTRVLRCAFTGNASGGSGAGLSLTGTGTLWNCGFTNNVSKSHGGAVLMSGNGLIDQCSFVTNRASTSNKKGGAISMSAGRVRDSDFSLNVSVYPGSAIAISGGMVADCRVVGNGAGTLSANGAIELSGMAIVTNCVITGNYNYTGGGVSLTGGTLVDCLIVSNRSARSGGGIIQTGGLMDRCRVLHNSIVGNFPGGGVYMNHSNAVVRNSLIAANASPNAGGGVYVNAGLVENCTIVGNAATALGDGIYVKDTFAWATNTIAYYNLGGDDVHEAAANVFQYGCASDVAHGVNGNLTTVPLFSDAGSGTPGTNYVIGVYDLTAPSPCRDAGADAAWMSSAKDLNGARRLMGSHVDMGAYEFYLGRGTVFCIQ